MSSEVINPAAAPSGLDELASTPPGVELAQLLGGVEVGDIRSDFHVLEVIAGWERLVAWAQARQLTAVTEFVRRPVVIGPDPDAGWATRGRTGLVVRQFADDEIAARLGISRIAAASRIDVGATLATTLPATERALHAGDIDFAKTRVMVDGVKGLPAETAREVEARVLPDTGGQNCTRLKQALRKAVIAADPQAAAARRAKANCARRVIMTALPDDMAEIYAILPALQAVAIDTALTAAARAMKAGRAPGDHRSIDQLRADAFAAPFEAALKTGLLDGVSRTTLAKIRGTKAQLNVTVPASVLLGISNAAGELTGYGPITADTARMIAGEATWRRLLTNPIDGTLLDVGTTTYRAPAPLDRHVKTRDRTCRHTGCNWPAYLCELDHSTRYPDGPTSHDNLGAFCTRHHIAKHTPGRGLVQSSPGVFRWTMPTGHTYLVKAPTIAPPLREELEHKADREHNKGKPRRTPTCAPRPPKSRAP
jgi:hypothetical protein